MQSSLNSVNACHFNEIELFLGVVSGKTCRSSFSPKQSESMDLFEEIIVEEHLKKEASYNEMKTKFEESRSQLEELIQKLQQLETQNGSLQTENTLLKKNICALIKTARSEIGRKDAEINRLSERTGNSGLIFHRPSSNQLMSRATTGAGCKGFGGTAPACEPHKERRNFEGKVLENHTLFTPVQTSSTPLTTTELPRAKDASVVVCERIGEPVHNHSSSSDALEFGNKHEPVSQHLLGHGRSDPKITASSSDGRGQNNKELKKDSQKTPTTESDQNRSGHSSRPSKRQHNHSTSDMLTSGNSKDLKGTKSQRPKSPPPHQTTSSQMTKGSSKDYSEDVVLERSRGCRETEGHKSRHTIRSESSRISSRHRREKSPTKDYHKADERWKDCANRENRSTRPDKSREHERKREREKSRRNQESTSKSEKKTGDSSRVPERKLDGREGRACTSPDRPEYYQDFPYKKDQLKKSEGVRKQPTEKPVDTADKKTKDKPRSELHSTDRPVAKENEGVFLLSNKNTARDGDGTKQTTKKGHMEMKLNSSEHTSDDERKRKKDHNTCQAKDAISEEVVMDERASNENSPNRKLSFMETLNLTLSPVKKPNQPTECETPNSESVKDGVCSPSLDRTNPLNTGEEFYVIDEVEESFSEEIHVNEKIPVSLISSRDHECCSKTATGESPVPGVMEMAVKSSPENDSLETGNEKENMDCSRPIPAVDQQIVVTTVTNVSHLIPQKENTCLSNSMCLTTTNSAAITENDMVTSVSMIEDAVIESSLDTEKEHTDAAEPTVLNFTRNSAKNSEEKTSDARTTSSVCSSVLQDEPFTTLTVQMNRDKETTPVKSCVYMDSVSSTVNLETPPSCPSSSAVCLDVPEVSKMETESGKNLTSRSPFKKQLNGVPNVSSTTKKDLILQEKVVVSSDETHAQQAKNCEPDSTENTELSTEPSSSMVLPQDEDSMMLTLKTIKLIPEAISPLTSPVRLVKKAQPPPPEKQPHIKSLSKDFQNATLTPDTSSRVVGVNKENQKPDCSTTAKEESAAATVNNNKEEELEEGEIVSESESDEAPVTAKSPKTPKECKKSATMKTQQSPQTRSLTKGSLQKRSVDLQPNSGRKTTTTVVNKSPTCKRRFKTVPPPDPKTLPPSSTTVEEIMNMFKVIRSQLRRKYMKLHKSFPMRTFSSVMEMSNLSFTDLVSSLNLKNVCGEESDVKAKMKNIIINVMNKCSNNGIVNRIFEQNSDNLKSKLWSFVDGQLDFLFKEIQMTLESASKPLDSKQPSQTDQIDYPVKKAKVKKLQAKSPSRSGTAAKRQQEEVSVVKTKEAPVISTPCPLRQQAYKTGLGSRGKNLRMNSEETSEDAGASGSTKEIARPTCERMPTDKSVDRVNTYVRRLSHTGSILDKSEFEILTEQQASSLTFNLVSDSQMGDIFKSLLQGSDLLESSVSLGDNQNWLLGTPKKDLSSERTFLTGMISPSKFGTPSKLMAAWASISPCKLLSPPPKVQMPLNPAVLDESCLMEIPSSPVSSSTSQPAAVSSQRMYSILAEDLAVSLTIPSPLKTDSHLSFLHPVNEDLSTPDEVRNAHFSEDAVLDGEDATEHDIHLSLDTDPSSCESSAGHTWDNTDPKLFQFKPHVPMQAVVSERSNDHFIVKIRHTSTLSSLVSTPPAAQSISSDSAESSANLPTITIEDPIGHTEQVTNDGTSEELPSEKSIFECPPPEITMASDKGDRCSSPGTELDANVPEMSAVPTEVQQSEADASECASKEERTSGAQGSGNNGQMKRKRKKHHTEPKAKHAKSETIPDRHHKKKHKKKAKSNTERELKSSPKKKGKPPAQSPPLSPQSLSAKNVIKKRGEVVVTWTRDEDRDILVALKMKGPSRNTFSALSEKMNKSPSQIAERFAQLMKLFKKKEKMAC
ncbi:CASP8-associated protein 2 [Sardina pilchardus]|uniref:CASP8-associated protein 2 n=1 Tax=Sardina pilchardus TaxID=27697 RepID=UPI002E0F194B